MIGRFEELVTPEEVVKISGNRTIQDMMVASDVYDLAFEKEVGEDIVWKRLRGLSSVWLAGYIQGIREERKKRKCSEG